jgi:hypothetical protein
VPAAQQRAQGQATVEALLDKSQPLPDPRALSRLYQEQALAQLPEESEEAAPAPAAASDRYQPPVAPPGAVPPPPSARDADRVSSQPSMTPAEMRAVMNSLQEKFSGSSYKVFAVPKKAPGDDIAEAILREQEARDRAELEELEKEARQSNLVSLLGALLVIAVIGGFIYLATSGPLKAKPAPSISPTATAKP